MRYLPYILLFLMTVSEVSDLLDGYIARKYNQVSDFGKIFDPMADSIARLSVFLTFTLPPVYMSMWLIFVLLYRDAVISTLRTICALRGFALAARPSGKIKAVVQAVAAFAILLLMIPYSLGYLSQHALHVSALYIVGAACIYTLFSGVDYIYAHREHIKKLLVTSKRKADA